MKLIYIRPLLAIVFRLITGTLNTTEAKTETQKYNTLYKDGNFEIRYYPEAILASVVMDGSYDDSRNSGFRTLAEYIFGGNHDKQQIAMTSPVRMSNNEMSNTMSFVLPSQFDFDKLPKPVNEKILLHQSKPGYAAVVQYGGYTNKREINKRKAELSEALNTLDFKYNNNNFEYLGYNPPYQMLNRKNEVLVELSNFDPAEFQQIMAKE